jgi:predicted nucleotidyltransferase
MVDIEKIKPEIIEKLKPLDPDKIILFGSYAYGEPNEESDIDLFLVKDNLTADERKMFERAAKKNLIDLMFRYKTNGIDILSAPGSYLENSNEYFYKVELLQKGNVWYER